jgi:hypothetical protein
MINARKNGFIFGTVLVLLMLWMPHGAHAAWVKAYSFRLFEYADPAYARTGTYDLYTNAQLAPPYRLPFYAVVNIGAKCVPPRVVIHGGVERGWEKYWITDLAWVQAFDPAAVAVLGVGFDTALKDGSSGTTVECPGIPASPDTGSHWLFLYPAQNQYRDQLGLEIGDLLMCETNRWGSGCRWYHAYR